MIVEMHIAAHVPTRLTRPASLDVSTAPRSANVLLIEPDPDCADALSAILASLAPIDAVEVVANLREAADALAAGDVPPAIILVDDQPGSTRILRAIDVLNELAPDSALVLLCVYPQCVDRRVRERLDGCVSKDVTRQELARVVADVLRAA